MNVCRIFRSRRAAWLAVVIAVSGCTLPAYKTKQGGIPSPQPLDFTATQLTFTATLRAVIVDNAPGAWKEETWWDEYVVTVANRGDAPLNIESATLVDFEGQASTPGTDPWQLEQVSQQWWQANSVRNTGYALALGVGAYGVTGVAFFGGAAATGSLTGGAAAATVVLVAVPVTIVGSVMLNHHQKHKIEAEFRRRRLVLPALVAPGSSATGSLFFRVSPGPQRLEFAYRVAGRSHELTVDLKPLAALHFKKRIYATTSSAPESSSSTPDQ